VARTIFIVDDHPPFREAARQLLESEGFDVVGEAADGASAVREAQDLEPEIILLDVHLPDFDGFEVARRVEKFRRPPIVILTSSREDYASLVEGSAAHGFVLKDELSGKTLADALMRAPEPRTR
jgi:DNA-binding NarL/FixJ family response regulator